MFGQLQGHMIVFALFLYWCQCLVDNAKVMTKVQHFVLHKFGSLGAHNAMHNDRLKPVRIPLSTVKWFGMSLNRSLQAIIHCSVYAKGAEFLQSATNNSVLLSLEKCSCNLETYSMITYCGYLPNLSTDYLLWIFA